MHPNKRLVFICAARKLLTLVVQTSSCARYGHRAQTTVNLETSSKLYTFIFSHVRPELFMKRRNNPNSVAGAGGRHTLAPRAPETRKIEKHAFLHNVLQLSTAKGKQTKVLLKMTAVGMSLSSSGHLLPKLEFSPPE